MLLHLTFFYLRLSDYKIFCKFLSSVILSKLKIIIMIKHSQKILFFLLLTTSLVQSKTLEQGHVRKAGDTWFQSDDTIFNAILKGNHHSESFVPIQNEATGETIAYAYQLEPTGFIVLSNDNRINPILAYSDESRFYTHDVPQNTLLQMIRSDLTLRFKAIDENRISTAVLSVNQRRWTALLNGDIAGFRTQSTAGIVGPFLSSLWGQGKVNGEIVFNLFTPNNWSTGCVATAMSQILHYYHWPEKAFGSHKYNEDDAGVISVKFDSTVYDWENMIDVYKDVVSTQAQKEAVALLGFHCGVSVEMDYEYTGSTASTRDVPAAVSDYFAYNAEYADNQSAEFFQQLKNEMLDKHPVQIAVSTGDGFGHSVVVDGYADHNDFYHLNMGWLGENNGWYDLAGSFYAGGYSIVDGAVYNFLPVPVFKDTIDISGDSLCLSWKSSFRINSEKYELQHAESNAGPWFTFANTLQDTFFTVNINNVLDPVSTTSTIYFRVRAFTDSVWGGWSSIKTIKVKPDRKITFRVNMSNQVLDEENFVVVRGNILPLSGYQNSKAFSGPDSNGVYEATIAFDYSYINQLLLYRFAIVSVDEVIIESNNREYQIKGDEHQTLPTVYFDNYATKVKTLPPGSKNKDFRLLTNYPNPFNASTTVLYSLSQAGFVYLSLYDVSGRLVSQLIKNEYQQAGFHKIGIDFNQLFSINGSQVPASGTYFVVLKTVSERYAIKILYLK